MQKRNKCIKLADKSPAGWALVDEYLGCELASDEEDGKRIKRAEAAVQLKYDRRQKQNATRGYRGGRRGTYSGRGRTETNYHLNTHQNNAGIYANAHHYANTWPQGYNLQHGYHNAVQAPTAQFYTANGAQVQHQAGYQQRTLGPCYHCRGPHLRNACPELAKLSANVQQRLEGAYRTQ